MLAVHNDYPKDKRALCAYLHSTSRAGFKGHAPLTDGQADGQTQHGVRSPTHFHLSRYMHVETTLLKALAGFCLIERSDNGWAVKSIKPLKQSDVPTGVVVNVTLQFFYEEVIRKLVSDLPSIIPNNSSPANFDSFLESVRTSGSSYFVCMCLYAVAQEMRGDFRRRGTRSFTALPTNGQVGTPRVSTEAKIQGSYILFKCSNYYENILSSEILALNHLCNLFYTWAMESKDRLVKKKAEGTCGALNRAKFPLCETEALAFVRQNFYGLDEPTLLKALSIGKHSVNGNMLSHVHERRSLHRKYSSRLDFDFEGMNLMLEASGFGEKWIGNPIGRFVLVVYPNGTQEKAALKLIADPTFEHSDGAVATARISITNGYLILEELQTDVETLVRNSGQKTPLVLAPMVQQWRSIAMHVVHLFCAENGFKEFYAATPYRVYTRYGGPMHPDKSKLYFDFWERIGGELVFDQECAVNTPPQYFYRFDVDSSVLRTVAISKIETIQKLRTNSYYFPADKCHNLTGSAKIARVW